MESEALQPQYLWLNQDGEAPGRPGLPARWTSSVKDSVGTAYSTSARAWFTLSHGVLDEIYYPTIDRPQTRDMGFLVSDGTSFFHEEKRDMQSEFSYIHPEAPGARQVNRDPDGRYTITKETITDPHAPVVLIRVRLQAEPELLSRLHLYALASPHMAGGGAHNNARVVDVAGWRVLLAWREENSMAMAASCGFSRASCGFVGKSDGWQDLSSNFRMDWQYGSATDGNVAVMGEVDLSRAQAPHPGCREFVVAIGFGERHHAALAATMSSLATSFDKHLERFVKQWERLKLPESLARHTGDGGRLLRTSQRVVLTHEDKTFAGAFTASLSIPWGYAKGDDDLGGYHLVWTRDMVQSATALLAVGRTETALRALVYLACTQKPDGSFAQNFWVNGTPYWKGIQLDEVAFPIILAWRLWKAKGIEDFNIAPFVSRAAGFLVRSAPVTQQERWEENAGYSPSTLAAVIAALCCAAEIEKAYGSDEVSEFLNEHADWIQSHLEDWTVTEQGVLHPEITRYYVRIFPPAPGEPWYQPEVPTGMLRLNNREPGERTEFRPEEIVDGGFLELVRYGVRRADDPLIRDTLKVVDHVLRIDTPRGTTWRRYNHDGYGEQKDGGPFTSYGQGRAWPLLAGERGHYELAAGGDPRPHVCSMEGFASPGAMLPEQVWDQKTPVHSAGEQVKMGDPAGSAMPLVWAHAEYLKLVRSIDDGRVFDCVSAAEARYGAGRKESRIEMWKRRRPISTIAAGKTLRILAGEDFNVVYSLDGWTSQNRIGARFHGDSGYSADISIPAKDAQELVFTLFWSGSQHWEGKNFSVKIEPTPSPEAHSPAPVLK